MMTDTVAAQAMVGISIELEHGRTVADLSKGPEVIWAACMIPIGRFDRNGDTGYVVDVITALAPTVIRRGLTLMSADCIGMRFLAWCSQNSLPQPDAKVVRRLINGIIADPQASMDISYVDTVGEVETGLWSLANGVMVEGEFVPMERGTHRQTSKGRRIVYAPGLACEETCGPEPLGEGDDTKVAKWASDMVGMFGSVAPLICAAWIRASVFRSRIEGMDAQLPALYICGDSHRGKTLMATVCMRMLGSKGERPHANMSSSSNAGVFLMAASRVSLPFIMDEVKPYSGIHDNDLVKSLVNGDVPAKSTRSGRLRASTRVKSMPVLVSEFVPGDTSSVTNRVFTLNLVTLGAMASASQIPGWVWWSDAHRELYSRWSNSIYSNASTMTDEAFHTLWREAHEEAVSVCDDACVTLNRSLTATTIALLGFRLLNADCNGALDGMRLEFCSGLSRCLREMSKLVTDVGSISRFITSLKSGWASMEGRYSKLASDRVFNYSDKYGFLVDVAMLHGLLIDSRRIDASRLGNPATVGMILEGEGFQIVHDDKQLKGRYALSKTKFLKKEWAHEMSRLTKLMDCTCGSFLVNAIDSQGE